MDKLVTQFKNLCIENNGEHLKQFVCVQNNVCPPINIFKTVAELHYLGYKFNKNDYLSIIRMMRNGGRSSFILNKQVIKTDSWNRKELVSFVFSNYTPVKSMIMEMVYLYENLEDDETIDWINILMAKKYIFNIFSRTDIEYCVKKGYIVSNIIDPRIIENKYDFSKLISWMNPSKSAQSNSDKEYNSFVRQINAFIEMFHKLYNVTTEYLFIILDELDKRLFERDIDVFKNLINEFAKKNIFLDATCVIKMFWRGYSYEKISIIKNPLLSEDEINNNICLEIFSCDRNKFSIVHKYLINLIEDGYLNPTTETIKFFLDKCIKSGDHFVCEKYINYFERKNILTVMNSLEMTCLYNLERQYMKIINIHKIVPDKICLDNCVSYFYGNINDNILIDILESRILPDDDTINSLCNSYNMQNYTEDAEKTVELLIKHGLRITQDILKKLFEKNIFINNLERFGINYDEKFYFMCHDVSYNIKRCIYKTFGQKNSINAIEHYYNFFTIDKKILDMRKLFSKKSKWETIRKYLIKHNVKPDRYCMEYSCANNNRIAELLFKTYDCKPTPRSVLMLMDKKDRLCMNFYIDFYHDIDNMPRVDSDYMMNPYDITIV